MRNKLFMITSVLALAAMAGAQTKTSGTISCAKPDPMHTIDVGDRPGHSVSVSKAMCTWSKPLETGGAEAKEGYDVVYADAQGDKVRISGYHASTLSSGDKIYVRFQGVDTMKNGKPATSEGTWSYTGGTGKVKGIKGKGTYKGTPDASGNMVTEVEGEYTLPAAKK